MIISQVLRLKYLRNIYPEKIIYKMYKLSNGIDSVAFDLAILGDTKFGGVVGELLLRF